jgi:hypothetical protein
MICIFEVTSPEVIDFKRIIHIGIDHTFEDLHQIIQNAADFDQSQLASFYLTDDRGKKYLEISSLDSAGSTSRILSMRKIKINDYITEIGQKSIYVFDFFNERFFYFELKERIMKTDLKEPFVAYENGKSPSQFLISDLDSPEVDLIESNESYKSFGDLEDYYEIFGEMDA